MPKSKGKEAEGKLSRSKSTAGADDVKGHSMLDPTDSKSGRLGRLGRLKNKGGEDDVQGHSMLDPADSKLTKLDRLSKL
jgi:hypothetical protein